MLQGFRRGFEWLIVDHYDLDARWESRLRPVVRRLLVLDDLAERAHDCDMLLDASPNEQAQQSYVALVPPGCELLLGPRYALLRKEFALARRCLRTREDRVSHLLISFGGSDPVDMTSRVLQVVLETYGETLNVDVVLGPGNTRREAIACQSATSRRVTVHSDVDNMAELMAAADLGVGGGGGETWERCSMGLPSIVVTIADNQRPTATTLAREARHVYIGDAGQLDVGRLRAAITMLVGCPELRAFLSDRAAGLVDGRGVDRVVSRLLRGSLVLRLATASDSAAVYAWRNSEEVRRHSRDPAPIDWNVHQRWFACAITNPARVMLIGESMGEPIGVLRYDVQGDHATVSVYLVAWKAGGGLR